MRRVCPECHKRGVRLFDRIPFGEPWCIYCSWHPGDVRCTADHMTPHEAVQLYMYWEVNHLACDRKPLAWFVQIHVGEFGRGVRLMQATVYLHFGHKQYKVFVRVTPDESAECPYGAHVHGARRRPNLESVREGWYRVPSFGREVDLQLAAARAVGARFLLGVGSSKYDLEREVEVS